MKLEVARAQIEALFGIVWSAERFADWAKAVEGRSFSFSPGGKSFVAVCSGGVKPEAADAPALCASPEIAVRLWYQAMIDFVAESGHVPKKIGSALIWREEPEVLDCKIVVASWPPDGDKPAVSIERAAYMVYSRLALDL